MEHCFPRQSAGEPCDQPMGRLRLPGIHGFDCLLFFESTSRSNDGLHPSSRSREKTRQQTSEDWESSAWNASFITSTTTRRNAFLWGVERGYVASKDLSTGVSMADYLVVPH